MLTILPTDTCYGLAGSWSDEDVALIYQKKGRDVTKRLAVLVRDFAMLDAYGELSASQRDFLQKYPRPWSVLLPRKVGAPLPPLLQTDAYREISWRVASVCLPDEVTRQIVHDEALDFPMFLTSANLSGERESTTLEEAMRVFPGVRGIDGGVCDRPPSDVFRFTPTGGVEYVRKHA